MLDCGLTSQTVLNFLPLPLVQSSRFQSLPNWICPRDHDAQADGELKECCNRIFIDSPPEFNAPLDKIVDFSEIDVILISNYMNMLALPFITGKLPPPNCFRIHFHTLMVQFQREQVSMALCMRLNQRFKLVAFFSKNLWNTLTLRPKQMWRPNGRICYICCQHR